MLKEFKPGESVAWNMDMAHTQQISNLLNKADSLFCDCNFIRCFITLKAIKLQIIQNLKQEERESLAVKEKEIHDYIDLSRISDMSYHHKIPEKIVNKAKNCVTKNLPKAVESYREVLMDHLAYYGFLSNKKKDRTNLGM